MKNREMMWVIIATILLVALAFGATWFTIYRVNSTETKIEIRIRQEGAEAFEAGLSPESNPYTGSSGIYVKYPQWWLSGWMKAKREIKRSK